MPFANFYCGKRVLLTGHTGFKGSWLAEWLLQMGAEVFGLSLEPPTSPALFEQLDLRPRLNHKILDIRDREAVKNYIERCEPDLVFHLAAQPIVRASYEQAVDTYSTNVMGTIHVMDGLRALKKPCAAVMVTTDKCYKNHEDGRPYGESDELGGHDPYSSSKACAELAIDSFRRSFFSATNADPSHIALASARAGNVIGGGDWAIDRIIPDCARALLAGGTIRIRNRWATRPWQHVLEPLSGYLLLGMKLHQNIADPTRYATSFNFGPTSRSNRTVLQLVEEFLKTWPGEYLDATESNAPHEAGLLQVSIEKADRIIQWRPVWDFETGVKQTAQWYRALQDNGGKEVRDFTVAQINDYVAEAKRMKIFWALG